MTFTLISALGFLQERVLVLGKGPYVLVLKLQVDLNDHQVGVASLKLLLIGSSLPVNGKSTYRLPV